MWITEAKSVMLVLMIEYKTKIVVETPKRPHNWESRRCTSTSTTTSTILNIEVKIPLKYLSNFRRPLDLPLINCKVELHLLLKKGCVLTEHRNDITVNKSLKMMTFNCYKIWSKHLKEQYIRVRINLKKQYYGLYVSYNIWWQWSYKKFFW